jgi:hypothetical protein
MKVVVLFEESGAVRDAFAVRGHEATSVDLRPARRGGPHIVEDVFAFIRAGGLRGARRVIAHPTCTFLNNAGLHWNHRIYGRHASTLRAVHETKLLFDLLDQWVDEEGSDAGYAVENPQGIIGTEVRPRLALPQTIQPFNFGEDASKATVLWRRKLANLRPTGRAKPRLVDDGRPQLGLFGTGVERWGNQTDSGQNALGPSPDRWSERSTTYPGIAKAMAEQWG